MEETNCEIVCGALTTVALKGLMMMVMMMVMMVVVVVVRVESLLAGTDF